MFYMKKIRENSCYYQTTNNVIKKTLNSQQKLHRKKQSRR